MPHRTALLVAMLDGVISVLYSLVMFSRSDSKRHQVDRTATPPGQWQNRLCGDVFICDDRATAPNFAADMLGPVHATTSRHFFGCSTLETANLPMISWLACRGMGGEAAVHLSTAAYTAANRW